MRFIPFAYGFRPFFLAAGLFAVLAVAAWGWVLAAGHAPFGTLPPYLWHGHEMLFGFVGAAVAGFLLTAVPSWTGSRAAPRSPRRAHSRGPPSPRLSSHSCRCSRS